MVRYSFTLEAGLKYKAAGLKQSEREDSSFENVLLTIARIATYLN